MRGSRKFPFTNRELTWLSFNERVFEEARDGGLPLLERIKFLAISSSNLDEFFMVRVGGLQILAEDVINRPADPSGLSPLQQLEAISNRVHAMVTNQYSCYIEELEPQLARAKIKRIRAAELNDAQISHIEHMFDNEIFPVLSPIAVSPSERLPLLANKALHIGVRLKGDSLNPDTPRYAVIPIGKLMSRFITLPSASGYQFMLIEDIVFMFVNRFFPGEPIDECVPFRITRNADLGVREDLASDLLAEMQEIIDQRKRSDCVRLEVCDYVSKSMLAFLTKALELDKSDTYEVAGPLDLSAFMKLTELPGYADLKNVPWPPQPSPNLDEPGMTMFDHIQSRNIFLFHPYESFEPVLRLIDEAADDPDVITIKQILYRTSRNSPIVTALIRAAQKGKYVTALVELKARFDEERNIEWARELEDAGVQVLYGVKGLKTHAKVCLIVRRGPQGLVRFMHFGTGNYNEITAQLYSDISYMTCDEDLGADTSLFFNSITGYSQPQRLRKLEFAPIGLREKLLELIENGIECRRQGQRASIRAKMNSLADPAIIKALYAASQAGVTIDLNVRGICCLRPGIPKVSSNISVVSIVDRFLEHARIFQFRYGSEDKMFLSTADWMSRNLDKRIELFIPIEDADARKRLTGILDICFKDTANSWQLQPDGRYERLNLNARKKRVRCQEVFYQRACEAKINASKKQRTILEPHQPAHDEPDMT